MIVFVPAIADAGAMDPIVTSLTHRADVFRAGWTDHDLRRCERRGELVRVRRGSYADPAVLADLDAVQRHRLALEAATRSPTTCVLSHVSAAVVWGMPIVGADLSRVHFIRPGASGGRRRAARVDHGGSLPSVDVTRHQGLLVTTPARTLVDLARTESLRTAVVAADHALHGGSVDPVAVEEARSRCARMTGMGSGRQSLRRVDGRSESPGETLTRLALDDLIALDAQVELRDATGRLVGRADLAAGEALTVIEFDGRQKYLSLRAPGQSIEDAVLAEKRREDAIRSLGYLVVRVVWSDLADTAALRARVSETLTRGRDLRARGMVPHGTYRPAVPLRLG